MADQDGNVQALHRWQHWAALLLGDLGRQPIGGEHGDEAARLLLEQLAVQAPGVPRCSCCGCFATRHVVDDEERGGCVDCECAQYEVPSEPVPPLQAAHAALAGIVGTHADKLDGQIDLVCDLVVQLLTRAEKAERERDEWARQCNLISEAQASALSGESDAVRRAESAELGCEIAYRREPTQAEGDAHEDAHGCDCCEEDCQRCAHLAPLGIKSGECFVPMGGWTGRRCRTCRRWAWGGPTVCNSCAAFEAGQERADAAERERDAARAEAARLREAMPTERVLLMLATAIPHHPLFSQAMRDECTTAIERMATAIGVPSLDAARTEVG